MKKFTKIIAPALFASLALGAAVPASAQPWQKPGRDNYSQQINQLDRQVERAEQRRIISSREASVLDRKVNQLNLLHRKLSRDGLSRSERQTMDQQIANVQRLIAREAVDRNGHRR